MNNDFLDYLSAQLIEEEIKTNVSQLINELIDAISTNTESSYFIFGSRNELASSREIDDLLNNLADLEYDSDDEFHMNNLKCDACECKSSLFWRRVTRNKIVCNTCFFSKIYLIAFDDAHLNAKKSTNINDLMDILGDELGLNEKFNNVNSKKSRSKSIKNKKPQNNNSNRTKQKFLALGGDQQLLTRPLTRTTAKASFNTQLSTSSAISSSSKIEVENQNQIGEEESSCGSSSTSENIEQKPTSEAVVSTIRKSARVIKNKLTESNSFNNNSDTNQLAQENDPQAGVNRRTKKFKLETRPPVKCERIVSTLTTNDCVYHRGFYMKVGDIVALFDYEDNDTVYYAQIRAFLTDQYGNKSAVITWLVPIDDRYKSIRYAKDFDVNKFVLGPSEEYPRPLECMEFVARLEGYNPIKDDYINKASQYENDMMQHRFLLEDLAARKLKLISKKTFGSENSQESIGEYEIKSN